MQKYRQDFEKFSKNLHVQTLIFHIFEYFTASMGPICIKRLLLVSWRLDASFSIYKSDQLFSGADL